MRRNFSHSNRFPGYYRQDYLVKLRGKMSVNEVAREIDMNRETAQRVFRGTATQKQVWRVKQFLKASWTLLHDLDRPITEILELHRAALNGNSRSVR